MSPKDMKVTTIGDAQDHLTELAVRSGAAALVPPGAVLFVVRGMILAHTFPVAITSREVAFNQDMRSIVPHEGVLGPYLVRVLQHEAMHILHTVKESTHGTRRLESEVLRPWPIPLPPLPEQERIVERVELLLAEVAAAKERLARASSLLKRFRQAVLAAACSGRLTEDRRRDAAQSGASSPSPVDVDALPELPECPSEWRLATIGEVAESIRYGCNDKADNDARGVPMLRMGNIQDGRIDLTDLKFVKRAAAAEEFRVRRGDLLFNRTNSPELVGKAAVYEHDREAIFASYLVRVRFKVEHAVPEFAEAWIMSPWGRAWARHVRTDGVSQSNINATKLAEMPIPLPGVDEQREIVRRLRALLQIIAGTSEQIEAAGDRVASLSKAILAKAFRGELVPTEAELARAERRDYETAEQLLARVLGECASDTAKGGGQHRRAGKGASGVKQVGEHSQEEHKSHAKHGSAAGLHAAGTMFDEVDSDTRHAHVFSALWRRGPLEKDAAVRLVAEHLREAGHVTYQRLRADGQLYLDLLAAVESAVKAGVLDRPRRGHVRAVKSAQTMTADDWRYALVSRLDGEPVERDDAIRHAAEWACDNMGVTFERLRADGHIVTGLRSAINSAVRRGEVVRHGATHIARAAVAPVVTEDVEPYRPGIDGTFNPPPPRLPEIEHRSDPRVVDGDKPVLVLQSDVRGDEREIHYLAMMTLAAGLSTVTDTTKRAGWTFYLALDRAHVEGLSTWLGIGPGVPAQVVDLLQKLLESTQHRVAREYAVPARHGLAPFLVATDDAIEFATGLDDDLVREHFEDDLLIRRPLVPRAGLGKAAKLNALLFGSDAE